MPAIGIAGAVALPVRAQALGTHPGRDLVFASRRAVMPLHRHTGAHRRTLLLGASVVSRRSREVAESATWQSGPYPAFSNRCAIAVSGTGALARY